MRDPEKQKAHNVKWRNANREKARAYAKAYAKANPKKARASMLDKSGHTCAAGAGSIQVPGYHGHLQNGELVP